MRRQKRRRWVDLAQQAANDADEYKYYAGTDGGPRKQSCTSDMHCTNVVGQLCFATHSAASGGTCHCPRTKPVIIPQPQQRGFLCAEHRLLFEPCRYSVECAYSDLNLRCLGGVCVCPKPLHISHTGLCIRQGQIFSAAGIEQPWTLMSLIFSVFILGLCIPFLLETLRNGVGPLQRFVREPPAAAAIPVEISSQSNRSNNPINLTTTLPSTKHHAPSSRDEAIEAFPSTTPILDLKSDLLTRLENVLGIVASSQEDSLTSLALLKRLEKGDFEPTLSIDRSKPTILDQLKHFRDAGTLTEHMLAEVRKQLETRNQAVACCFTTGVPVETQVSIKEDTTPKLQNAPTIPQISKSSVTPLRRALSPGTMFHTIYQSTERFHSAGMSSKNRTPQVSCSTCTTFNEEETTQKTDSSKSTNRVSTSQQLVEKEDGPLSERRHSIEPLEHRSIIRRKQSKNCDDSSLSTMRLLNIVEGPIPLEASETYSPIVDDRIQSPDMTKEFSARLIRQLQLATKLNRPHLLMDDENIASKVRNLHPDDLYEIVKDVLKEEYTQYLSGHECSTLGQIPSIDDQEEVMAAVLRKTVRFNMPSSSSSAAAASSLTSRDAATQHVSDSCSTLLEQGDMLDEIATPPIPEDSDMTDGTRMYWKRQRTAEKQWYAVKHFPPLFTVESVSDSTSRATPVDYNKAPLADIFGTPDQISVECVSSTPTNCKRLATPGLSHMTPPRSKFRRTLQRKMPITPESHQSRHTTGSSYKGSSLTKATSSVELPIYSVSSDEATHFEASANLDIDSDEVFGSKPNKHESMSTLGQLSSQELDEDPSINYSRTVLPSPFSRLIHLLKDTEIERGDERIDATEPTVRGQLGVDREIDDAFILQLFKQKPVLKKWLLSQAMLRGDRPPGDGLI